MCLTITDPKTSKPLVATEDIEVYKIICCNCCNTFNGENRYFTPYMSTRINFDEEDKAVMSANFLGGYYALDGEYVYSIEWHIDDLTHTSRMEVTTKRFHSPAHENAFFLMGNDTDKHHDKRLLINEGIHAYVTKESAILHFNKIKFFSYSMMVAKCIVPKGSVYFLGDSQDGEIAANKMIVTKEFLAVNKQKPDDTYEVQHINF